jgi:hypothetical protein
MLDHFDCFCFLVFSARVMGEATQLLIKAARCSANSHGDSLNRLGSYWQHESASFGMTYAKLFSRATTNKLKFVEGDLQNIRQLPVSDHLWELI